MPTTFYIDESGHSGDAVKSGDAYDFKDQPFFVLAAVGVEDEVTLTAKIIELRDRLACGDPVGMDETFPLRDVSELAMILPALPNLWRISIDRACAEHHISLNVPFELDSPHTVRNLVAEKRRYSILPTQAVLREVNEAVCKSAASSSRRSPERYCSRIPLSVRIAERVPRWLRAFAA